jgi:hypothetical protein
MPRIKSLLNGEISNVRGDIAREMIKLGVAEAIDNVDAPESAGPRLPKWRPAIKPNFVWSIDLIWADSAHTQQWIAIRRDMPHGNLVDTSYCVAHPESVHNMKDHTGAPFCSAFGCRVPEEILEQYRTRWKRNEHQRAAVPKVAIRPHVSEQSDKARIETTAHAEGIVAEQNGRRMVEKMR